MSERGLTIRGLVGGEVAVFLDGLRSCSNYSVNECSTILTLVLLSASLISLGTCCPLFCW